MRDSERETLSGSLSERKRERERESARNTVRVNEKEVPSDLVRVRARLELRKKVPKREKTLC